MSPRVVLFAREIQVRQTSPPGTWWKFSWRAELPHHRRSLLFRFGDSVFLNPCQRLENYPQNKLLDKDLKPSLSKAQTIASHTHWLKTVSPLAIVFIMLSCRLFYPHDLIIKCQSLPHQMPQGEIVKSATLTRKEIGASFTFSKHSLPPGLVALAQWTSCSSQEEVASLCCGLIYCRTCKGPRSLPIVFCSPRVPRAWGGLEGHSSPSWANLLPKGKGPK